MSGRFVAVLLLLAGFSGAWSGLARLHAREQSDAVTSLLYLPNGKHLRVASLGHPSLAADFMYLWAIQYYGNYDREDRYKYVEHIFGSVIPELDPQYIDAYSLGVLILTVEAGDLEAGLRVVDRGMAENPDQWVLPYLAGWECYRAKRFDLASKYMGKAVTIPGAPLHLLRNRAGFVARSGDMNAAYRLWKELYDDPESDVHTRTIAERQMRDLHVRIDLRDLGKAIEAFRERTGKAPMSLEQLVSVGILSELPLDPDGNPYPYDAVEGRLTLEPGRILGAS